jgi:hypothetical protein
VLDNPGQKLDRHRRSPAPTVLPDTVRAALVARLNSKPTKADWALWQNDLDRRLMVLQRLRCAS